MPRRKPPRIKETDRRNQFPLSEKARASGIGLFLGIALRYYCYYKLIPEISFYHRKVMIWLFSKKTKIFRFRAE